MVRQKGLRVTFPKIPEGPEPYIVRTPKDLALARFRLGLPQQDLLWLAIGEVETEDDTTVSVRFRDWVELTGSKRRTEKGIMQEMFKVGEPLLVWRLDLYPTDKELVMTKWVTALEYVPGRGTIEIGFSRWLTPYLLEVRRRYLHLSEEEIIAGEGDDDGTTFKPITRFV